MTHERLTTMPPAEVIERAKRFFADRAPHQAAYPEHQGPTHLVLRGQGGEEVALAVFAVDGGHRVRASTLLFDQSLERFLSTLPTLATAG